MTRRTQSSIRILIVEDDDLLREELACMLDAEPDMQVRGCAADCTSGLTLLQRPHDVLIVDIGLPDGSGIDLLCAQRREAPEARSLVMTVYDDAGTTTAALRAGADGYVLKTDPRLTERIRQVAADQHPIDPAVTGHLLATIKTSAPAAAQRHALTPREQQTLVGLSEGLSYSNIADQLQVSPHTVTDYIKGIYRKLQVNSRSEAVYQAVRQGLLSIPRADEI